MTGRFDYVKYDEKATTDQAVFKALCGELELIITARLAPSRPTSLALTKLEEVYMWIGKAIRDEQVLARGAEQQEGRGAE
jgi:hypothetical protein